MRTDLICKGILIKECKSNNKILCQKLFRMAQLLDENKWADDLYEITTTLRMNNLCDHDEILFLKKNIF